MHTTNTNVLLPLALALALGSCGSDESPEEERAARMEEAAGELAEGTAEAAAAAEGANEIQEEIRGEVAEARAEAAMEAVLEPEHAVARMAPTEGHEATGSVRFDTTDEGVRVTMNLSNLEPGATHAIHIHEHGSCAAPDGSSAGGHYAPRGHDHGLPPSPDRHAGDMGNVTADANGEVHHEQVFSIFSLDEEAPVVGRAVILHADADQGTQPSGGAGDRVACGTIQPLPET